MEYLATLAIYNAPQGWRSSSHIKPLRLLFNKYCYTGAIVHLEASLEQTKDFKQTL
jgi:hypothetical protein